MTLIRLLVGCIASAACGGGRDDACADAPTFTEDVEPIAQAKCAPCHSPGAARRGAPEDLDFDDWPSVEPVVDRFADAITSGRMPPPEFLSDLPAVTAEERAVVSRWRMCGFRE